MEPTGLAAAAAAAARAAAAVAAVREAVAAVAAREAAIHRQSIGSCRDSCDYMVDEQGERKVCLRDCTLKAGHSGNHWCQHKSHLRICADGLNASA